MRRLLFASLFALLSSPVAAQTVINTIDLDAYLASVPKPYYLLAIEIDGDAPQEFLAVHPSDGQADEFFVINVCASGVVVGAGFYLPANPTATVSHSYLDIVGKPSSIWIDDFTYDPSVKPGFRYSRRQVALLDPCVR